MEVLYMNGSASLLRGSYGDDDDDDLEDIEEFEDGYDDEFG